MGGDSFSFKNFTVKQSMSAMKVGTDGIILGAWAEPSGTVDHILDIGAGTGLIALMLAQRFPEARIDGVEIDANAAVEATDNAKASPYGCRVEVKCCDFQNFSADCARKYELVVSNPPYFDGSYKSTDSQRMAARHRESLPFEELVDGVLRVLCPSQGKFFVILPAVDAGKFIKIAHRRGLYCHSTLEVIPRVGKSVKRVVAEFSTDIATEITVHSLTIMDELHYTEEFKSLTSDFYLRF